MDATGDAGIYTYIQENDKISEHSLSQVKSEDKYTSVFRWGHSPGPLHTQASSVSH